MAQNFRRTVVFEPSLPEGEEGERLLRQSYANLRTGRPIPRTTVYSGTELLVRVNSLGCTGDELQGRFPVIGYFGAALTFGTDRVNWPRNVAVPGTQNLNGTRFEIAEVDEVTADVERYLNLKQSVDFIAAVFQTVYFQPIGVRAKFWRREFDRVDGAAVIAHCTVPSPVLIDGFLMNATDPHSEAGRYLSFDGQAVLSSDERTRLYVQIQEFNSFIADYCREKDRVLIDLATLLKPQTYDEIPQLFDGVMRPSIAVHRKIATYVGQCLDAPITAVLRRRLATQRKPSQETKKAGKRDIYPIW